MNAPFLLAQASPQVPGLTQPRLIQLAKPAGNQSVTVQLDGATRLDFSQIGNETVTLVRVGEKLIILFDNQTTVTVEPVFGADGAAACRCHVRPDRRPHRHRRRVCDAVSDHHGPVGLAGSGRSRRTGERRELSRSRADRPAWRQPASARPAWLRAARLGDAGRRAHRRCPASARCRPSALSTRGPLTTARSAAAISTAAKAPAMRRVRPRR